MWAGSGSERPSATGFCSLSDAALAVALLGLLFGARAVVSLDLAGSIPVGRPEVDPRGSWWFAVSEVR